MFKLLAILFMFIDHSAYIFAPHIPFWLYITMRIIGRLAFPMFAYALARGYNRSRNIFYYFLRLAISAIVTQILFNCFTTQLALQQYLIQNILITFTLALAVLAGCDLLEKSSLDLLLLLKPVYSEGEAQKRVSPGGIALPSWLGALLGLILIVSAMYGCYAIEPDYSFFGILTIFIFQKIDSREESYKITLRSDIKKRRWLLYFFGYTIMLIIYVFSAIKAGADSQSILTWSQFFSLPAVLFFPLYERAPKPSKPGQYFFYAFYPLHFILLLCLFYIANKT